MNEHKKINYLEFAAIDLVATKIFFSQVFSWQFVDYGSEYTAFSDQGLDGGIYQAPLRSLSDSGAALIIFYSEDLESTLDEIERAGGVIVKSIFSFPGGRRFHFTEPSGNEFAVWSDRGL